MASTCINICDTLKINLFFQHVYTFSTVPIQISSSVLSEVLRSIYLHLFFFVSGYFTYKTTSTKIKDCCSKIRLKFVQLVVPSIIFLILYSLLEEYNFSKSLIQNGWATYWFTIALFTMFIIYITVDWLINIAKIDKNGKTSSIIYIILAMVLWVISYLVPNIFPLFELNNASVYFPCFILGILAKKYNGLFVGAIKNNVVNGVIVVLYILSLIVAYNDNVKESLSLWLNPYIKRIIVLSCNISVSYFGIFAITSFFHRQSAYFEKDNMFSRTICMFGRRTMDIYMIHYFLLPKFSFDIRSYFETYYNPVLEILVVGGFAVGIMALSTLIGEFIRNSEVLSRYMLGVMKKRNNNKNAQIHKG